MHARDLALPAGVTLVAEPEALVLHVLAAPTAEQIEADLGEPAEAAEAPAVPGSGARRGPRSPPAACGAVHRGRWLIVGLGNPGPATRPTGTTPGLW